MKIWKTLVDAWIGWQHLLAGDADWRSRFRLTDLGLATAIAIFALVAFLAIALGSMSMGMPNIIGVLAGVLVLAFPLFAMLLAVAITRKMLKSSGPALPVLVPATYALVAFLVIEALLGLVGGPIILLSWLALGYLLYQLGRAAQGWNHGVAAGFAVLTILLLVAMRWALYMLTNPAGSPI